ncbi:transposase [Sphingomonas sp. Root710]|uniref:transposase n=1 Tax=Sphingomonas sp. Root710 TaxID=1736594 RepID=UPI0007018C93|nr:transposase [Sphingomonas sp. Root710]KRB85442.1 transposase [Sphingomonas sp. Root710]
MARLARLVLPGIPHHVTQRGNRREQTFFEDADYTLYRRLVADAAAKAGTEIWGYCLMPNHVHMIVVPADADGLRRTFAEAHRRYTAHINARNHWTGHLWQGRFGAVAMDETHLAHAMRYVSLNPVRARLVRSAQDWPWSSVRAHLSGRDDGMVRVAPALTRYGDFADFIAMPEDEEARRLLRRSESTGRPLGDAHWISGLEDQTGRSLAPRKRGPKPKISTLSP